MEAIRRELATEPHRGGAAEGRDQEARDVDGAEPGGGDGTEWVGHKETRMRGRRKS